MTLWRPATSKWSKTNRLPGLRSDLRRPFLGNGWSLPFRECNRPTLPMLLMLSLCAGALESLDDTRDRRVGAVTAPIPYARGAMPASAKRLNSAATDLPVSSTARQLRSHASAEVPGPAGGEQASTYALAFGSVPLGRSAIRACSPS